VKKILLSCATLLFLAQAALPQNTVRKAPELAFEVPDQGQKLLSQYRGKVIVLDFISTTCSHCQAAAKMLTRFQQEYGARGFQALDVAINALDENRNTQQAGALVRAFARDFQVGFPVGWVKRDEFMSFLGFSFAEMTVVPQVVLIDRKGYIHYQTTARGDESARQESTIRQRIEELLSLGNSAASTPIGARHATPARPLGQN
jgi:thiol-disulfide isomerase/thioredoxin